MYVCHIACTVTFFAFSFALKWIQDSKDVEYDTIDNILTTDVREVQNTDYNYITGDEVVTHTNEAYITSTRGMEMNESVTYGHTGSNHQESCAGEGEDGKF